jgi:hypothetical protein
LHLTYALHRAASGGAFMCILYPLGIPLLFAALMRHERRTKNIKVRRPRTVCAPNVTDCCSSVP